MRTFFLYLVTALAELIGCYAAYAWLRLHKPAWVLLPGAAALLLFAWLLTLHPAASGRVYAAYGGIYIAASLIWLWAVDGIRPNVWDLAGGGFCLLGTLVIYFAPRT